MSISARRNTAWNDPAGLAAGQSVGRSILEKTEKLQQELNVPLHRAGGVFPVAVAPFNEVEAATRNKVEIYKDFVTSKPFESLAENGVRVPFNINEQELTRIVDEKRAAMTKLNFYEYLNNLMRAYGYSPDIVSKVRALVPEYYEEQLALIDRNLDLQRMWARLMVKGVPDTQDELMLLYAVSTGDIKIPENVAWKPSLNDENDGAAFVRGIFSVKKKEWPTKTALGDTFLKTMTQRNPGTAVTSNRSMQSNISPGNFVHNL